MRTLAFIASVVFLGLGIVAGCDSARGQEAPAASASRDEVAPLVDPGWPRQFAAGGQSVTVYQPQVDDWKDYAVIHYRAVVEVQRPGEAEPRYGILSAEARTDTDVASRTVVMMDEKFEVRFLNTPEAEEAKLVAMVKAALPDRDSLTISLDRVLAYVEESAGKQPPVQVSLDPPPIFYSAAPAILVMFMGEPSFQPIGETGLMFATNTNWDVFLDTKTKSYFLLNGMSWLTTNDVAKGPWSAARTLPAAMSKLPANDPNWADVRKALPGVPAKELPKVIVTKGPAELLLTEGAPQYRPIEGTGLMQVSNTESSLLLHAQEKQYYYLVAGRWFRATTLEGPWSAATTSLPADFSKIPEDGPAGYLLASIPGTQAAEDAVLLASIPQRATVNRMDVKLTVAYEGEPKFAPIEGTAMAYAVNSPNDVIKVDTAYYCCANGVWFYSGAAVGPWSVCVSVPKVIYTIPPKSPVHNVTYVYVYSSTPDVVVVGYTGGYTGQYVASGVVMFGAGMITGAVLANNYHYPTTYYSYGCGAVYNGAYGGYARGAAAYGPYGGAGRGAAYNPATGTYARGAYAYGPNGSAFARQAYNPQSGNYAGQAGGSNAYGSWSRGVVSNGDQWARGGRNSNANGTTGWVETSGGRSAVGAKGNNGGAAVAGSGGGGAVRTQSGDIYAGKDGNVYKRQDGQWSKNEGGGWSSNSRGAGGAGAQATGSARTANPQTTSSLNRDAQARTSGNARASSGSSGSRSGGGRSGRR